MERLTDSKRNPDGTASSKESLIDIEHDRPSAYCGEILTKLADYEDLEEQGRLIKLPCKVGDTVYHVIQGRIIEVSNIDLFFLLLSVAENRFNNSVFLTQSEAEAKLAEMKKNESEE